MTRKLSSLRPDKKLPHIKSRCREACLRRSQWTLTDARGQGTPRSGHQADSQEVASFARRVGLTSFAHREAHRDSPALTLGFLPDKAPWTSGELTLLRGTGEEKGTNVSKDLPEGDSTQV